MELPRELAPWAPLLGAFPVDVAAGLGPIIQRLDAGMGPLGGTTRSVLAPPDGFDGVTNRGPLSRVLSSEWMLAAELPDEFIRRFAQGELGYLQLAHRGLPGKRRCVVLMDVGPRQLGAPRLVHLAALVVLGRRAAAAGVPLVFGTLQQPRVTWDAVEARTITSLLATRSSRSARTEDVDEWKGSLGKTPGVPDDVWVVGDASASAAWPEASCLAVDEPLLERDHLECAVTHPTRPPVTLRLPLPDANHQVRLLSWPFGTSPVARPVLPAGMSVHSEVRFSNTGGMLLWRTRRGEVASAYVQQQGGGQRVTVYRTPNDAAILAAGTTPKGVVLMGVHQGGVCMWVCDRGGAVVEQRWLAPAQKWKRVAPSARLGELVAAARSSKVLAYFALTEGVLTTVSRTYFLTTLPGRTHALTRRGERVLWAHAVSGGTLTLHAVSIAGDTEQVAQDMVPLQVVFGAPKRGGHPFHLTAVRVSDTRVRVVARKEPTELNIPQGATLLGVVEREGEPWVVVAPPDLRALYAVGPASTETLCELPAETKQVCVSPNASHAGGLLQDGSVFVVDVQNAALGWRLAARGQA